MRKTSYFITFLAVSISLLLNVLSIYRPDWLYVNVSDIFHTRADVWFGLLERCERSSFDLPGPGENGRVRYSSYTCRPFPTRKDDRCETDNSMFCTLWWTAEYSAILSVVFGAGALVSILVGASTRSRRRRVWRAVAGLAALHASFKIITFSIVTDAYRDALFPIFEYARPSTAYVLNTLSWIGDVFIVFGVIITGLAAEAGHAWAAGNRAYRPVSGG